MQRKSIVHAALLCALAVLTVTTPVAARDLMLIANDEKLLWDDAGKPQFLPPGKDTVMIVDIGGNPLAPTVVGTLPLMNTIMGPPTGKRMALPGHPAAMRGRAR